LKAVYETADGGRTWRFLAGPDLRHKHSGGLCFCGYAGEIAFSGSFGLLTQHRGYSYRSSDGGRTWRPLRVTSPELVEGDDASVVSANTGYLLRGRFSRYEELLRTRDGGRTWRVIRHWSATR
jgi:photosystem II stability/assembly factor-like uncharacterized protein